MYKRSVAIMAVMIIGLFLAACGGGEGPVYVAELSRAEAAPTPDGGRATGGTITAVFDEDLTTLKVKLSVEGGQNVTAAHFHCGREGPLVFGLFSPGPLTFDGELAEGALTASAFTGADCTEQVGRPVENIGDLAEAMRRRAIFLLVHTSDNPDGEIQGQLERDFSGSPGGY